MLLRHNALARSSWYSAAPLLNPLPKITAMRQKPNPEIIAWAQDLAAQGTDPNEMMKRLLKAGWLFDAALQILQPHHPDWVTRQQRRPAPAALPTAAQQLQTAVGIPKD